MQEQTILPSMMLGNTNEVLTTLPFAMLFASEPAYLTLPKDLLPEDFRYNPEFQVNDETRLNTIMAGQTSTSIRRSTRSTWMQPTEDDDAVGDEGQ